MCLGELPVSWDWDPFPPPGPEPCVWPCNAGYSQGGCSGKPGDRKTADAGFAHLWWAGPQEPSRWQPACSRFQSNISSTLWHSPRGRRPRPKSCSTWGAEGGAMGHTGAEGHWARAGQRKGDEGREGEGGSRAAEQSSGSLKARVGRRLVVPSDTGQPSARSSCGSAGPPGTPLWSPHAPWPAAGHTTPTRQHHSGPFLWVPWAPAPSHLQPDPLLTIWTLSAGRPASGPSPG